MTTAAGGQRHGTGQISGAVSGFDQMTQQNVALVEESAAAAERLKDQAGPLNAVVAHFRLRADAVAVG